MTGAWVVFRKRRRVKQLSDQQVCEKSRAWPTHLGRQDVSVLDTFGVESSTEANFAEGGAAQ